MPTSRGRHAGLRPTAGGRVATHILRRRPNFFNGISQVSASQGPSKGQVSLGVRAIIARRGLIVARSTTSRSLRRRTTRTRTSRRTRRRITRAIASAAHADQYSYGSYYCSSLSRRQRFFGGYGPLGRCLGSPNRRPHNRRRSRCGTRRLRCSSP